MQCLILSRANTVIRSFFLSCFSFPRFVVCPVKLALGTHHPCFVACMVVDSCNRTLGRRQKREQRVIWASAQGRRAEKWSEREGRGQQCAPFTHTNLLTHQSLYASHRGVVVINLHARRQWVHHIVGSIVGLGNLQNGQNEHQSPFCRHQRLKHAASCRKMVQHAACFWGLLVEVLKHAAACYSTPQNTAACCSTLKIWLNPKH